MKRQTTRRDFLKKTTLAGIGFWTVSCRSVGTRTAYPQAKSPNDKLNIGIIGCGGKGYSDMKGCEGENIVALCDVDENSGGQARKDHPDAKFYHNFRF